MVKSEISLDKIFFSLSDPTRRDIVRRVAIAPLTVNTIAAVYSMSPPAISKHLKKLEDARLVIRTRQGKGYLIQASPLALKAGRDFFNDYQSMWNTRLDALGMILDQDNNNKK